jgi:nitroimidazol reductase NimA-like FMN-containing flavoprotein (pyridoxamine 5'-phosphate oxidase superfamily)
VTDSTPTQRTRVRRLADRGKYDAETVHAILDEGLACHVGFVIDGQPFVIPTLYARVGGELYIHGSAASRMLRTLSDGVQVCVTVTLVDGLVLARSIFNHSMNYRSVVILGRATLVEDREEKLAALEAFSEQIVPGRWKDVRQPTENELKQTKVLAVPLDEVSAKVRTGEPHDDDPDYALPIWAGILPLPIVPGTPIPDARCLPHLEVPVYLRRYSRNGRQPQ